MPEILKNNFRTEVIIHPIARPISHHHTVFVIGSCFSEYIGKKLQTYHFKTCLNPSGILFNPLSISQTLKRIMAKKPYQRLDIFKHDGLWKSFDYHSDFDALSSSLCLQKINRALLKAHTAICKADFMLITFGTSFVYYHIDSNRIVANCHKLSSSFFRRQLLPPDIIVKEYDELLKMLKQLKPELSVILAVSPIRHIRDNLHENCVSKAHLITAIHKLQELNPWVFYFPSYEIMMDELRDYRFYGADMVHPSEVAIDFIWQKFSDACISEESQSFIYSYDTIYRALSHKIKNPRSRSTKEFALKQLEYTSNLEKKYSISLKAEKRYFSSLLA